MLDGEDRRFECASVKDKREVFNYIYAWLRRASRPKKKLRQVVRELCARHRVDMAAFCAELCMGWDESTELAADPLVTIGAHTVNHPILTKLDDKAVRFELASSRDVIEAALGRRPEHLAYPVGDRSAAGPREFQIAAELGFKTAVTTRPGVIFRAARASTSPRCRGFRSTAISSSRATPRCCCRAPPPALWNGFRPVNVT